MWAAVLGTLLLLASSLVGSVPAGGQSLGDARRQREATLEEKARAAQELSVLEAQEDELRRVLAGLDEALVHPRSRVEAAQQAVAAAEEAAARRQQELLETSARIDELRRLASAAMVDAYIGAAGLRDDELLGSSTANEYVQRQHLLGVLEGRHHDHLDQLRALGEDQRILEEEARAALARAAALREELAAAEAELRAQRDAQGRLEDELRSRISDWQAQVDQLTRAEAELDAIIEQRLAEQSARARPTSSASGSSGSRTVAVASAGGSGHVYPTTGPITSSFGYRRHPILGTQRLHAGLDIGARSGTDVWASKSGQVLFSGWNGGYGNCVMIQHGDGVVTLYGHLSAIYVSQGQSVSQGTVIGAVGSTGMSTGPHLHFETRLGGQPQDPLLYLG